MLQAKLSSTLDPIFEIPADLWLRTRGLLDNISPWFASLKVPWEEDGGFKPMDPQEISSIVSFFERIQKPINKNPDEDAAEADTILDHIMAGTGDDCTGYGFPILMAKQNDQLSIQELEDLHISEEEVRRLLLPPKPPTTLGVSIEMANLGSMGGAMAGAGGSALGAMTHMSQTVEEKSTLVMEEEEGAQMESKSSVDVLDDEDLFDTFKSPPSDEDKEKFGNFSGDTWAREPMEAWSFAMIHAWIEHKLADKESSDDNKHLALPAGDVFNSLSNADKATLARRPINKLLYGHLVRILLPGLCCKVNITLNILCLGRRVGTFTNSMRSWTCSSPSCMIVRCGRNSRLTRKRKG